jgi:hypothetical protein
MPTASFAGNGQTVVICDCGILLTRNGAFGAGGVDFFACTCGKDWKMMILSPIVAEPTDEDRAAAVDASKSPMETQRREIELNHNRRKKLAAAGV